MRLPGQCLTLEDTHHTYALSDPLKPRGGNVNIPIDPKRWKTKALMRLTQKPWDIARTAPEVSTLLNGLFSETQFIRTVQGQGDSGKPHFPLTHTAMRRRPGQRPPSTPEITEMNDHNQHLLGIPCICCAAFHTLPPTSATRTPEGRHCNQSVSQPRKPTIPLRCSGRAWS